MKTTILSSLCIVGMLAMGSTAMAQDSTSTTMKTNARSQMQQKVPRMMKKMDGDGNKMISMDEAKAAKDQTLYDSFDQMDTSKDGNIDAMEFMAFEKTGNKKGSANRTQQNRGTSDTLSDMNQDRTDTMNTMDDKEDTMNGTGTGTMDSMDSMDSSDDMDATSENMDATGSANDTMSTMGNGGDQMMRQAFEKADTSGDGMIDMEEFMAYERMAKDKGAMQSEKMGNMKMKDSMNN